MASIRRFGAGSLPVLALLSAGAVGACSAPSKGALVLAFSTDMQAPKDINVVSVYITTNGATKFNYIGRVLPDGTVSLPSTLAVVEPDDPNAEVRVRVIAFQTQGTGNAANARVLRDILTSVPHERTALLRVPLNFLDDGSGQGTLPARYVPSPSGTPEGDTLFDVTQIGSKCDWQNLKQTSLNGVCVGATVDSTKLETYSTTEVFGEAGPQDNGAPSSCFDVAACFAEASAVTNVDTVSCSFPLPAGASAATLNVALAVQDTGTCTAAGCFVPLPNDPTEGWTVQGSSVQLAPGVCAKLGSTVSLVASLAACPAMVLSEPVCQPGEFVGPADAGSGCDGQYVVTCVANSACGSGSGGSAPLTITGTSGTISIPMDHGDGGTSSGTQFVPVTLTVDPATCVATFTTPVSSGSCDSASAVTIDTVAGTVSGVSCGYSTAGGCATASMSCTVARGTLDAGSLAADAGAPVPDTGAPPQDASVVTCPTGQSMCGGVCVDESSNPANCGMCGMVCAATETCQQGTCVAAAQDASASPCVPYTCPQLGYNCGAAADGCGGLLECGTCSFPEFCGGGGFDLCGGDSTDGGSCTPVGCGTQSCGQAGDGCGNLINCGSCSAGTTCGGGGKPSQCG